MTLGCYNSKQSWSCFSINKITCKEYILEKKLKVKMNYSFDFSLGLNLILCWIFLKGMQSA